MHSSIAKVREAVIQLVRGGEYHLAHLSDAELLTSTRRLVGTSNKLLAATPSPQVSSTLPAC